MIKPSDIENLNEMSSSSTLARFQRQLHQPKQRLVEFERATQSLDYSTFVIDKYFQRIFTYRSRSAAFSRRPVVSECHRYPDPHVQLICNYPVYLTTGAMNKQPNPPYMQQIGLRLRKKRGAYLLIDDYQ